MTEELYYTSAYITEFLAEVLECRKIDDSRGDKGFISKTGDDKTNACLYEVVLDRTAFFPEQGGQSSDIGILEYEDGGVKANVLHTRIENEKGVQIFHVADREIPVGTRVHGVIDWKHRFSNMQQHTGEHIFSGLVHSTFGYDNVGFHLSDSEVTMDYNGVLDQDDISKLEMMANQAIWDNLEVICEFPEEKELANIPYRSKKELEGDVRIVTIPGIDICACCAPHVNKTGEIGILKVVGLQNYKGGVRVNILCGKRALEYISAEHKIVSQLSGMLTTSVDNVVSSVKRAFDDISGLKVEVSKAKEALIEYEVEELCKDIENEGKEDIFVVKDDSFDSNMMRKFVNALALRFSGYCGVYAKSSEKGYRFIIASGTAGKDCKVLCDELRQKFGAKGGGTPAMVQGSLSCNDINEVTNAIFKNMYNLK